MTRAQWWLVDKLSRTLEPDERDAVCGDFAESGETGGRALRNMLGLVVRRQAALWKDWRPWLALVGLVAPVGYLLSLTSFRLGAGLGMQIRTMWKIGERYRTGMTTGEEIAVLACGCVALVLWAWTSGFVLGSLARRTVWVHGALFCLAWLGEWARVAWLVFWRWFELGRSFPIVFFVPILVQAFLFLLPSIWGMRRGLRIGTLSVRQTIPLAVSVATITVLKIWTGTWHQAALVRWSQGAIPPQTIDWQTVLLPYVVVCWPIVYIVATAGSRLKRENIVERNSI